MRKVVAGGLTVLVVGASGLWVVAALVPLAPQHLSFHFWLPFPAACLGIRCITYREWGAVQAIALARQGREAETPSDPAHLVSELLTRRAIALVARRAGLNVSQEEIDRTRATLASQLEEQPDLQQFLQRQYGDLETARFREGIRDLLLRQKLTAAGIPEVWEHPSAPSVTILHLRYRWDPKTHRVVQR